jgi:hypothetical protein
MDILIAEWRHMTWAGRAIILPGFALFLAAIFTAAWVVNFVKIEWAYKSRSR